MIVPPRATPALAFRVLAICRLVLLAGVGLVLFEPAARADGRVGFLSDRLKYPPAAGAPDDFRVRTNAALALGATADDAAVTPLCGGLSDPSEIVRQAAAVALKRLARPSSVDCLTRRAGLETNASVKLQIQRAIESIGAAGGSAGGDSGSTEAPANVANAKFYVSVSKVTNHTTRPTPDIDRIVHKAIASKLSQLGEYQLAPAGESSEAAKAALSKRKLKGYYLGVSVDNLDYSDGGLRVHVKIAVFSYPGRDLRGEVPAAASIPGARPGDTSSEDQLMEVVAGRAAELFAQNFR